jgi:hypothetical protein
MRQRLIQISILTIIIGASALVLLWTFVWNRGTLSINALSPFTATINNQINQECVEDPCQILIRPGNYTATINKPGFFPEKRSIEIQRGKVFPLTLEFKYIPVNTEISADIFYAQFSSENGPIPKELELYQESLAPLAPDDFFFYDPTSAFLKRWSNKKETLISRFTNEQSVRLLPDPRQKTLLIWGRQNVYLLNLKHNHLQKILEKEIINAKWNNSGDKILLSTANSSILLYDLPQNQITELPFKSNPHHLFWFDDQALLYGNSTGFYVYDLGEKISQGIVDTNNQLAIEEMILSEDRKSIYYRVGEGFFKLQLEP